MNMSEGAELRQDMMTDWCEIKDADPARPGPYECKLVGPLFARDPEGATTHKRWFDGKRWSWPLQPEHERPDGYVKPAESYFMDPDLTPNFAWRGYKEDQEPL